MRRLAPLVTFLTGCAFTLVLLARCGVDTAKAGDGDTSGSVVSRSGTRLHARVWQSPDGARQFLGWYDSELDVNCAVSSRDLGGARRCVPDTSAFGYGNTPPDGVYRQFQDEQCTQPIWSCTRFSEHPDGTLRGAGASLGKVRLFYKSGDTCQPSVHDPSVKMEACAISPDTLPWDTFLPLTETRLAP